jgi:hypothetical protein
MWSPPWGFVIVVYFCVAFILLSRLRILHIATLFVTNNSVRNWWVRAPWRSWITGISVPVLQKIFVEEASSLTGEAGESGYTQPVERGLGGDSGGLSLTIRTSAGGAAKNDAAVPLDGEGGESVRRKDCVGGNEKPALSREKDVPAEAKMRIVSWATRSAMRPSTKRPVSSM